MTESELIVLLQAELKGLAAQFEDADYANAADDAERDCGWTLPVTTDFKIKWIKERAKRHLFFYLLTESAHKFKYKQISLNHRFDHYSKLIDRMDEEFKEIMESYVDEFAGVSISHLFGHKIDAGYAYDIDGRDITYDADQLVIITPDENA